MSTLRIPSFALAALLIGLQPLRVQAFSVVAYNIENLFDVDGIAGYEDYSPDKYSPRHLLVKVSNAAKVLATVDDGRGPDILVLNEIEVDQTPGSAALDPDVFLDSVKNRSLEELLSESPLHPSLATLPAEMWLLKALEDRGLGRYHIAIPDEPPGRHEDGRPRTVKNVILSRFPVKSVKTLPTLNARAILEARIDVNGHALTIFANHWKSGAGSPADERIRRANAHTLRERLDEIFRQDPLADVIAAGDFNSHHNQNIRYPGIKESGINDKLGSQGNELALQAGQADLYNLWFELPVKKRGSDVYQNTWGTLMHIIVSRGLYDRKGIHYVDNSFEVLSVPGLNADPLGHPLRWSQGRKPSGFSDHFPILARFCIGSPNPSGRWIPLSKPSVEQDESASGIRVASREEVFSSAIDLEKESPSLDLRTAAFHGKIFRVDAPAKVGAGGVVAVTVNGNAYTLFSPDKKTRDHLRDQARSQGKLCFYAQLNLFKGEWQFFLPDTDWIVGPSGGKR